MRRWSLAAVVAVVLVLVTGCMSLPTGGQVQPGVETTPTDSDLELFAPGPATDADPEEIVRGFLLAAGSGLGDDFSRAREFLTDAGQQAWEADAGVTIYAGAQAVTVNVATPSSDGAVEVTVTAEVAATLDSAGRYAEAAPGTERTFTLNLTQTADDQWRVDSLDPGVLMSQVAFGQQFREAAIYFFTDTEQPRLVPDTRWVPRSRTAETLVQALLAGPSPWLQPAVFSAFPDGTALGIDGVVLDDRDAIVSLSTQFLTATAATRALAQVQLETTLAQVSQVGTVQVSVNAADIGVDTTLIQISQTPSPGIAPVLVADGALATLDGDRVNPLDPAQPVPAGLTDLTVAYGDGPFVALANSNTLVAMADGEPVNVLSPGGSLLSPSYDANGWVWTGPSGPGSNTGSLTAINPVTGAAVEVQTPEFDGADMVALRVSREGARLVYALRTDTSVTVYAAAITRADDGTPISASGAEPIGQSWESVRDLVWVDQTHIAVLGSTDGAVAIAVLGIGGQTAALPSVEQAVALSSGDGDRELFLVTSDGRLFGRSGTGWSVVARGVTAAAFPG